MAKKTIEPSAEDKLRRAFDVVLSTVDGREVFAYILEQSGYTDYVLRFNTATGDVLPNTMLYNAARRDFWIDLRKHMNPEHIKMLEATERSNDRAEWINANTDNAASTSNDGFE